MLDLTKPIRTGAGRKVQIMATNVLQALPGIPGDPARYEGQTILAKVFHTNPDREVYTYHYPDGGYWRSRTGGNDDLVNYVEPVVAKGQRAIAYQAGRFHSFPVQDAGLPGIIGIVEFTVTDGKLTNVEIINGDR